MVSKRTTRLKLQIVAEHTPVPWGLLYVGDASAGGQLKWDNFIVPATNGRGRIRGLKLIDWELAQEGDPCWDLGSVPRPLLRDSSSLCP